MIFINSEADFNALVENNKKRKEKERAEEKKRQKEIKERNATHWRNFNKMSIRQTQRGIETIPN